MALRKGRGYFMPLKSRKNRDEELRLFRETQKRHPTLPIRTIWQIVEDHMRKRR